MDGDLVHATLAPPRRLVRGPDRATMQRFVYVLPRGRDRKYLPIERNSRSRETAGTELVRAGRPCLKVA